MKVLALATAAAAVIGFAGAAPLEHLEANSFSWLHKQGTVSQDVFADLELYAEFSSAAYCNKNIRTLKSGSRKFTCLSSICRTINSTKSATIPKIVLAGNVVPLRPDGYNYPPQFYVAVDKARSQIVVAFEGTDPTGGGISKAIGQIAQDRAAMKGGEPFGIPNCPGCLVVTSFVNSWRQSSAQIIAAVGKQLNETGQGNYSVVFTGHSLGGALAAVAAAETRARSSFGDTPVNLYSYAAPAVGDSNLAIAITNPTNKRSGTFRVTHVNDPIPNSLKSVAARNGVPGFKTNQYGPEYYITTPLGTEVHAENITIFPPVITDNAMVLNPSGSLYTTGFPLLPHTFYIIPISGPSC